MALYLVEKEIDGITLLDLRGRITLGAETEALRTKLRSLRQEGRHRIILDLGQIAYIDSVGLSTLITGYTSARNAGGNVKLLHLPPGVHQLLQITRLSTVFEIYDDRKTAVDSFQMQES
jgi:anti-sigma B factor antagonist